MEYRLTGTPDDIRQHVDWLRRAGLTIQSHSKYYANRQGSLMGSVYISPRLPDAAPNPPDGWRIEYNPQTDTLLVVRAHVDTAALGDGPGGLIVADWKDGTEEVVGVLMRRFIADAPRWLEDGS